MSAASIILIEDEVNVGSTLKERLEQEGFAVTWAQSGMSAQVSLQKTVFDLALVDVGLPDISGFDIAESVRKQNPQTALIFLTAMGGAEDRIRGLELGAEDYIVKPFHLKELLLRVHNGLRRAKILSSGQASEIQIGEAKFRFDRFEVERDGEPHRLTHKECALMKFLYDQQDRVVSRDEILDHVWPQEQYPSPRTVDNFILRLRKWVEKNPDSPTVIQSVRGVGYLLKLGRTI